MVTCSACGHANEAGAAFCVRCNHFLAWSASASTGGARPEPEPGPESTPEPERQPRPEPAPAADQVTATPPATAPARAGAVRGLVAAIDAGRALVAQRERADLDDRLCQARSRMTGRVVTVALVGEFKKGKSTLVNALIQTAACPVDADIVTAVPTLVRWAPAPEAFAVVLGAPDDEPTRDPVDLADLPALVSERAAAETPLLHHVEIGVPHRMLRGGLRLLDTPGVGGLESVDGQVTLASLDDADALLFVSDASQELTEPEMDFLRTALQRCPTAALVVAKTDLHHQWRRIVELDQGHLAAAGVDLPVFAVSSFLRLRAARRPELNEESGFGPLVDFLGREAVSRARARTARQVAHEVDFVAGQLAHEADAERVALAARSQTAPLMEHLGEASRRAEALAASGATWQQTLADGIQDLVSDVEHDLQSRLRGVLRDGKDLIEESDPRDTWADTEIWLRREVAAAGLANRDLLVSRARELSDRVAEQFDLEAGEGLELVLGDVSRVLQDLALPSASTFVVPGGRLGSLLMAGRATVIVPMFVYSLGSLLLPGLGLAVAGAAASLGVGFGGKLLRDEGQRQRAYRQGQAKAAMAKFVDEAAFEMNKDTRDGLRRTQRRLRDEFRDRATTLQASAAGALAAARRAVELAPDAQRIRAAQIDEETRRLATLRQHMRALAASGAR